MNTKKRPATKKYSKLGNDLSKSELILLIINKLKLDRRRKNDQKLIEHLYRNTRSMTTLQVQKLSSQSPKEILKFLMANLNDESSSSSDVELETFTSNQPPQTNLNKTNHRSRTTIPIPVKREQKPTHNPRSRRTSNPSMTRVPRRRQAPPLHRSYGYSATYDSNRGGQVEEMECHNGQCRRWSRKLRPGEVGHPVVDWPLYQNYSPFLGPTNRHDLLPGASTSSRFAAIATQDEIEQHYQEMMEHRRRMLESMGKLMSFW